MLVVLNFLPPYKSNTRLDIRLSSLLIRVLIYLFDDKLNIFLFYSGYHGHYTKEFYVLFNYDVQFDVDVESLLAGLPDITLPKVEFDYQSIISEKWE